ncbi:MAG: nucleotidyltransferase family protein [Candidatus Electrothrix communis]|nr:MAG: nucleotidyltransferase family protein [Candidatus Electrothrix communis]
MKIIFRKKTEYFINPLLSCCACAAGDRDRSILIAEHAHKVTNWTYIVNQAERYGISPLLYKHVEEGKISIPKHAYRSLHTLFIKHRRANAIRMRSLSEILQHFDQIGIEVLVLKGAALANTVYPQAGLRPMRDIDLLVRPHDALQAQTALAELGFKAPLGLSSYLPSNHHHLTNATQMTDGLLVSVEIHHHLFPEHQHYPSVTFDDLRKSVYSFSVNEVPAYTLGHEDMLWHIYRHTLGFPAFFEPFRLIAVADLVSIIEKYITEIDWKHLQQYYPQVWNILPLLHCLTPWSNALLQEIKLPVQAAPNKAGEYFHGWPCAKVAAQRQQGKNNWDIVRDAFFPSEWWVCLHYGAGGITQRLWYRYIYHPWQIVQWLVRYGKEYFKKQ